MESCGLGEESGILLLSFFFCFQPGCSIAAHPGPYPALLVSPAVPPGRGAPLAQEDQGEHLPGRARRRRGCAGAGAPRQHSPGAGRGPERGRVAPASRAARRGRGWQRGARPRRPAGAAAVPGVLDRRKGPRPGAERRRWRRGPGHRAAAAAGRAAGSKEAESPRRQRQRACGTVAARVRRPPGAEMTGGSRQPLRPARRGAPAEGEACVRRAIRG